MSLLDTTNRVARQLGAMLFTRAAAYLAASLLVAGALVLGAGTIVADSALTGAAEAPAAAGGAVSALAALPIGDWSVADVQSWLLAEGLAEHAETFGLKRVDGALLLAIRDDVSVFTQELGIPSLLEARRVQVALARMRAMQLDRELAPESPVQFMDQHPSAWLLVPYLQFSPHLFWLTAWRDPSVHAAFVKPVLQALPWWSQPCVRAAGRAQSSLTTKRRRHRPARARAACCWCSSCAPRARRHCHSSSAAVTPRRS